MTDSAERHITFSYTENEEQRLQDLNSYQILDTPEENEFDALATLARKICGSKISQINFVDRNRQWNKATIPETPKEMPRGGSFCSTTIHEDKWLIVKDARKDKRFQNYPFVQNEPNIRFYAGVNLKSHRGHNVGTICVLDIEPREIEDWQLESLQVLASEVEARLELRRRTHELEEKNRALEKQTTFLENSTDLILMIDPDSSTLLSINNKVEEILGYKQNELIGQSIHKLTENHRLLTLIDTFNRSDDQHLEGEFPLKGRNGKTVWLRMHLTEKEGCWYATARNITKRKEQAIRIQNSLKEKEVLLSEIHHRVKNNLAIIAGMLELDAIQTDVPQISEILLKNRLRIHSMGTIHELLYQQGDFTNVSWHSYIEELNRKTESFLSSSPHSLHIVTDRSELNMNVNQAIPAALLLSELTFAIRRELDRLSPSHEPLQLTVEVGEDHESFYIQIPDSSRKNFPILTHIVTGSDRFNLMSVVKKQLQISLEETNRSLRLSFVKKQKKGSGSAFLSSTPDGP